MKRAFSERRAAPSQQSVDRPDACEIRLLATKLGWQGLVVGPYGVRRIVFDCRSLADVQGRLAVAQETAEPPRAWADWQPEPPSEQNTTPATGLRPPLTARRQSHIADQLEQLLLAYAAGQRPDWDHLPLDLRHCTPFQRRVIEACRRVAYGQKVTYGQLAEQVGSPRAARAVGSVMAKNRTPLIVPCHRVIGSGGALHGFSSRSGLTMKQRLLDLECNPKAGS